MSAPGQQYDVSNREQTIDHKPMRLKNKLNAVGSVGDRAAFPNLDESPSFQKVMPYEQARSSLD